MGSTQSCVLCSGRPVDTRLRISSILPPRSVKCPSTAAQNSLRFLQLSVLLWSSVWSFSCLLDMQISPQLGSPVARVQSPSTRPPQFHIQISTLLSTCPENLAYWPGHQIPSKTPMVDRVPTVEVSQRQLPSPTTSALREKRSVLSAYGLGSRCARSGPSTMLTPTQSVLPHRSKAYEERRGVDLLHILQRCPSSSTCKHS